MKIYYEIFYTYIALILIPTNVFGLPFLFGTTAQRRHIVEFHTPPDEWNIMSAPRSITPHLHPRNDTKHEHHLDFPIGRTPAEEEALLQRLKEIKVSLIFPLIF